MRVKVNGQFLLTEATSLSALRDSLYEPSSDLVMIVKGDQTGKDRLLQEDDEVLL